MTSSITSHRLYTPLPPLQISDVEDMQEAAKELESSIEKDQEEVIEQRKSLLAILLGINYNSLWSASSTGDSVSNKHYFVQSSLPTLF